MSKLYPELLGVIGPFKHCGLPVLGQLNDYRSVMDFSFEFEMFIKETIDALKEFSDERLCEVGIERTICLCSYGKKIILTLKSEDGAIYKMSYKTLNDCVTPLKVSASYCDTKKVVIPGVGWKKSSFDFKKEAVHVEGDYFERKAYFYSEEVSDSKEDTEDVFILGDKKSCVSACCLHPNAEIVYSSEEKSYVIVSKDDLKKPKCRENKYYNSDGTEFEQECFCYATDAKINAILVVANEKMKSFQQVWQLVFKSLGVVPQPIYKVKRSLDSPKRFRRITIIERGNS